MRDSSPVILCCHGLDTILEKYWAKHKKKRSEYIWSAAFYKLVPGLSQWPEFIYSSQPEWLDSWVSDLYEDVYVVVNFLSQLIFIFRLFLGMVMNANEFETKEI